MPQECRDRLKDIRRGQAITVGQRGTETYVWNGSGHGLKGKLFGYPDIPKVTDMTYEVKLFFFVMRV